MSLYMYSMFWLRHSMKRVSWINISEQSIMYVVRPWICVNLRTVDRTRAGPLPLENKPAKEISPHQYMRIAIMQNVSQSTSGRIHTTRWSLKSTIQPEERWQHSHGPSLVIGQQVYLRTAGLSHAGPLPLDNNSALGNPVSHIQAHRHYWH
jgi:hypothetical protein